MLEYKFLLIYFTISIVIFSVLLALTFFLNINEIDYEKLSAYECGFHPFGDARNTFDVKFYLVSILFLIFDLEVVYIFPWSLACLWVDTLGLYTTFYFLILLLLGFLYEWRSGGLVF